MQQPSRAAAGPSRHPTQGATSRLCSALALSPQAAAGSVRGGARKLSRRWAAAGALLLLRPAAGQGIGSAVEGSTVSQSPFAGVARQLVEEECRDIDPTLVDVWSAVQAHFFEAHSAFYSVDPHNRWMALGAVMQGLRALMDDLRVAYQCPLLCTRYFLVASEWALALGHPKRARALVQMGNIFKLQAMARWWNSLPQQSTTGAAPSQNPAGGQKYEPRLQVEYTIAVTQLHGALQVPRRPLAQSSSQSAGSQRGQVSSFGSTGSRLKIEVHSICTYKKDPTSNTGQDCPLPDLSVPNHRAYASRHQYKYVLHTTLPLPDREAHYSKMLVIHEALRSADPPDWVFFIDCDAFFTNPAVSIEDILETYGAAGGSAGPHFLVAEDPGGVNTGTLLFRRSGWSTAFLERVAASQFGIAWDQSMFFWEMLRPTLLEMTFAGDGKPEGTTTLPSDFALPSEVAFVHQAHMNAFVQPAARDWSAYEWQPGDVVRHFAGCPWQEAHCLGLMRETAEYAQLQFSMTAGS